VAELVGALRYKPEGRWFDPRWCHWNFSLTEVDSASNRNEYQEYFLEGKGGRCLVLTTLPPSWADCLEKWETQPPRTLKACPSLYGDYFIFLQGVIKQMITIWICGITIVKHKLTYAVNYLQVQPG